MAYTKTVWKARQGTGLNRFNKTQETDDAVNLTNAPLTVTIPGTPFSEENMNHIEQGIEDAHEGIAAESQAREQGDNELAQEISAMVETEAQSRQSADQALREAVKHGDIKTLNSAKNHTDSSISQTNENLQTLQTDFNAWIGRGGYLDAFDFGSAYPSQEDLTNYALSQISSINDPLNVWNGTKVINLYNGFLWILTNTQNTDPPVFEWAEQGPGDIAVFRKNMGGYIVGADPDNDPPGYIVAQPNGKGKIDLDAVKQMLFEMEHPVGDVVVQLPGALSPIDKRWPGTWLTWNDRASEYRLRQTPIPSYTTYTPGANYAANAVVMWHLPGDNYAFFRAVAAVTSAEAQLNPKMWNQLIDGIIIERKDMLDINPWTNNDLVIGGQITGGYWIEEIIVYGGKFPSFAGGNRPPFVSGGTAGDVQRQITGGINILSDLNYPPLAVSGSYGALANLGYGETWNCDGNRKQGRSYGISLNTSLVIPTGAENSNRTISTRTWRRVA